ncbi:MAG TPA: hypothetical protein VLF90_02260 [Patescibacteria group bacterium]|nr:hypothetical protein [Patescibacteria group bacterium]
MSLNKIEDMLSDVFVKKAPKMPENGKKALVQYLPWIDLVLGILTLWSALVLWHWAHLANAFVNYANSINQLYGNNLVQANRLTAGVWFGLIVLIVEGVLYLAAFPGLRERKKSGWNLLFYASMVNVVYAIVIFFTDYGGIGTLLGSLIGTAIGLYILFQVRSAYKGHNTAQSE